MADGASEMERERERDSAMDSKSVTDSAATVSDVDDPVSACSSGCARMTVVKPWVGHIVSTGP